MNEIVTPETTEVIDIREVSSWLKDKSWSRVEMDTDCLNVVRAIRGTSLLLSYFGRIIQECKQLVDDQIIGINFIKSSRNIVAHFSERSTCSVDDRKLCTNTVAHFSARSTCSLIVNEKWRIDNVHILLM